MRVSSRSIKFLKIELARTPMESREPQVRQETAAGVQPARQVVLKRFAKMAYSVPDIAQQAGAAQEIHGTFLAQRSEGGNLVDFVGTGRRLTSAGLLAAANKLGVDAATIRAVLEVETAGAGFDPKKRLKLLFEPHIFYRQLGPGPKREEAVRQGLAYAKAGTRRYPPLSKRYDQISAAIAIDETAALNSASWGLPQIMGFNHEAAGFQSAKAMVTSMLEGEDQQLEAFANLLSDWKLSKSLKNRDWRRFALKYNGPNALKNGYDTKLGAAFKKFSGLAARAVARPGKNQSFVFPSGL